MVKRYGFVLAAIGLAGSLAVAQTPAMRPADRGVSRAGGTIDTWRSPGVRQANNLAPPAAASGASGGSAASGEAARPAPAASRGDPAVLAESFDRPSLTRVSKGTGTLPNHHGQVWREYDISPYTTRVANTRRPEQAIVDWILRETGYEAWHSEVTAVLSADARTLRVYHTPDVQRMVSEIVDRFVNTQAEAHTLELRLVTVGTPNWRANLHRILKPIPVQTQGIQAWMLNREDAALLLAQLNKRTDFREYTLPPVLVQNAQSAVVGTSRPRRYIKGVLPRDNAFGFEPEMGQIDEGYSLEFSPLMSIDGQSIDAVVKCQIQQVEKMLAVMMEVPTQLAPHQRQQIEIPQMISCDLHERFRWPVDQVLLISRGVVASPLPKSGAGVPLPAALTGDGNRADALIFIHSRGRQDAGLPPAAATGARPGQLLPLR